MGAGASVKAKANVKAIADAATAEKAEAAAAAEAAESEAKEAAEAVIAKAAEEKAAEEAAAAEKAEPDAEAKPVADAGVQFTDTEGDVSTLKLVEGKLQWWATTKGKNEDTVYDKNLRHLAWGVDQQGYDCIYTKQHQGLFARLVQPKKGPLRDRLKQDLVKLAIVARTHLEVMAYNTGQNESPPPSAPLGSTTWRSRTLQLKF